MTSYSEQVVLNHLTDPDALDALAREGFTDADVRDIIPSEHVRILLRWSLDEFFASGRTVAPSKDAIKVSFGDLLEQHEVVIDDETEGDTIHWAIGALRQHWAYNTYQGFVKESSRTVADAEPPERILAVQQAAIDLTRIARSLTSRKDELAGAAGVEDALFRYRQREADGQQTRGMLLGMPEIDGHTLGIHPGEIAVFAAGTGVGKSWLAGHLTLTSFRSGLRCGLFTLENDVFMTYDRLVCMAAGVNYELWQRAQASPMQMQLVEKLRDDMKGSDAEPLILQLSAKEATPTGIMRRCQLEGLRGAVVDQTSHIRPDDPRMTRMKRFDQLNDIFRTFKELLRDEWNIPLALMNQINRDGVTAARKSGQYHKEHMADGSAIENYASFLWALYQSEMMRAGTMAQLQCLKSRRVTEKHFALTWRPEVGDIRCMREIELGEAA